MLEGIKAVIFDHDDTLVSAIPSRWQLHKFIAQKYYGKTITDDEIRAEWGNTLSHLFGVLYGATDLERAALLYHQLSPHYPKQVFTHTAEVLHHLHERGLLLGVVTSTDRETFESDVASLNLPRKFLMHTQTEEDTREHKPDPAVFAPVKKWLATQGISEFEALYVGDTLKDLHAATGAGLKFIGVTTGLCDTEEFQKAGALIVKDLNELIA